VHLLAHPRTLPCLLAAVERVAEAPRAAATAASALWALLYQGEKVRSSSRASWDP
jgi:rotatin